MNQIELLKASSSGIYAENTLNVEELKLSASGAGDVRYYGDPKVEKKTSSLGSVKKK